MISYRIFTKLNYPQKWSVKSQTVYYLKLKSGNPALSNPIYPFVFMDCIHYKVREDGRILSRAAYVVLGVNADGYKDILSITVGANETSKFWLGMLNDLKNRGVEDVLFFCSENFFDPVSKTVPPLLTSTPTLLFLGKPSTCTSISG